jgi:hypothetical protein
MVLIINIVEPCDKQTTDPTACCSLTVKQFHYVVVKLINDNMVTTVELMDFFFTPPFGKL